MNKFTRITIAAAIIALSGCASEDSQPESEQFDGTILVKGLAVQSNLMTATVTNYTDEDLQWLSCRYSGYLGATYIGGATNDQQVVDNIDSGQTLNFTLMFAGIVNRVTWRCHARGYFTADMYSTDEINDYYHQGAI